MNETRVKIKEISKSAAYERLVNWYGAGLLSNHAMADLAELIAAVSRMKSGSFDYEQLVEKLAAASYSIDILKEIYNIDENDVNSWKEFTLKRGLEKIAAAEDRERFWHKHSTK